MNSFFSVVLQQQRNDLHDETLVICYHLDQIDICVSYNKFIQKYPALFAQSFLYLYNFKIIKSLKSSKSSTVACHSSSLFLTGKGATGK